MKLVPLTGIAIATVLAAAGCSSNAKYAAARTAEERAAEDREEAREARADADQARREAAAAQADAQRAAQAQRDAELKAQAANDRAARAELQASREAYRYGPPRPGVTERQPDSAVMFAPDSVDLTADTETRLDNIARGIRARGQYHAIIVEGYSDGSGSEATNVELSQKRARAVADYLANKGVPRERIQVRGWGSRNPISHEDSDRGRALNRRVEVLIEP